ADGRDPARLRGIVEPRCGARSIGIKRGEFAFVVANDYGGAAAAVVIGHIDAHAAVGGAAIVLSRAGGKADFFESQLLTAAAIHVQEVVVGVVGGVNIRTGIAIEINHDGAHSLAVGA